MCGCVADPVRALAQQVEANEDTDDDLTYLLGRHCAARASMYHRVHHCRRSLYEIVGREAKVQLSDEAWVRAGHGFGRGMG